MPIKGIYDNTKMDHQKVNKLI